MRPHREQIPVKTPATKQLNQIFRGTQREYSSKPLKHSIGECILVFKR